MTPEVLFPLIPVVAMVGGGYLLWRYVKAVERRKVGSGAISSLQKRVAELEDELSSTIAELERVKEGQGFTERLLADRHKTGDKRSE
jgi:hypothetical protein